MNDDKQVILEQDQKAVESAATDDSLELSLSLALSSSISNKEWQE